MLCFLVCVSLLLPPPTQVKLLLFYPPFFVFDTLSVTLQQKKKRGAENFFQIDGWIRLGLRLQSGAENQGRFQTLRVCLFDTAQRGRGGKYTQRDQLAGVSHLACAAASFKLDLPSPCLTRGRSPLFGLLSREHLLRSWPSATSGNTVSV